MEWFSDSLLVEWLLYHYHDRKREHWTTTHPRTVLQDSQFAALKNNFWSLNFLQILQPKPSILRVFDNFSNTKGQHDDFFIKIGSTDAPRWPALTKIKSRFPTRSIINSSTHLFVGYYFVCYGWKKGQLVLRRKDNRLHPETFKNVESNLQGSRKVSKEKSKVCDKYASKSYVLYTVSDIRTGHFDDFI